MSKTIYTHNLAMEVIDVFEDFLEKYDITIPSADEYEAKERWEEDNTARIYGTEWDELMNDVEAVLIGELEDTDAEIIKYEWRD